MSASKMRKAVTDNDFESFKNGLPSGFKKGQELFDILRNEMGIKSFNEWVLMSEAYSFFPKNENDIDSLPFPENNIEEIKNLFNYLNNKFTSVITPINIDLKRPNHINVTRQIQTDINISDIRNDVDMTKIKIKFGNGSSGNRGANNRGNAFENQFSNALIKWWAGEEVDDSGIRGVIEDLDTTYGLKESSSLSVEAVGGLNTKRPLEFGSNIVVSNIKGTGLDVGSSVTDVTLTTDSQVIFLSLKYGTTTTFFNVGVRTILTPAEIQNEEINNINGKQLLDIFGIDPVRFCKIFNKDKSAAMIDKRSKYNKSKINKLIESGIGYNYHIVHKLRSNIISKKMDRAALRKSAKLVSPVVVYYGGKKGRGRRIDIEFESTDYIFKINIRDTQGNDGYPTRMMCDFKPK
jgi:hypothetical protein